ncbi:MAG: hypothetical protein NTV46_17605, partial [Verrucomicrobia bacterium]|nr:hypothetical protein [Verrucomicrobiota bacterium]
MAEIPFNARTEDPALLQAFRLYEDHVAVANVKRALALGAIFMLVGSALDWIVFPEHAWVFLLIRVACALLLGSIYFFIGETPGPRTCYFASFLAAVLPMIGICAMITFTGGGNSMYYAGLNL